MVGGGGSGSNAAGGATVQEVSRALVYFAKAPRPGLVKTRLCPPLRPEAAARLYAAMLQDVLLTPVEPEDVRRFVWFWPPDAAAELAALVPPALATVVGLRPQAGAGLAERMAACFSELCAEGFTQVVLRGTDSPGLPAARVAEAFALLGSGGVDVVLGPDRGGGYYLVGLTRPRPELFLGVAMGGDSVFAATCARVLGAGLRLATLAVEDDIDVYADLERFRAGAVTGHVARWAEDAGLS
jgi:rSAM/selenodomain-associated transferase 1